MTDCKGSIAPWDFVSTMKNPRNETNMVTSYELSYYHQLLPSSSMAAEIINLCNLYHRKLHIYWGINMNA